MIGGHGPQTHAGYEPQLERLIVGSGLKRGEADMVVGIDKARSDQAIRSAKPFGVRVRGSLGDPSLEETLGNAGVTVVPLEAGIRMEFGRIAVEALEDPACLNDRRHALAHRQGSSAVPAPAQRPLASQSSKR